MDTLIANDTRIAAVAPGRRVATYQTLDGARRAVRHVIENGYDATAVTIRPRGLAAIDDEDALRADRFEVVVDGPVEAVEHLLARWWDPEAVPAPAYEVT